MPQAVIFPVAALFLFLFFVPLKDCMCQCFHCLPLKVRSEIKAKEGKDWKRQNLPSPYCPKNPTLGGGQSPPRCYSFPQATFKVSPSEKTDILELSLSNRPRHGRTIQEGRADKTHYVGDSCIIGDLNLFSICVISGLMSTVFIRCESVWAPHLVRFFMFQNKCKPLLVFSTAVTFRKKLLIICFCGFFFNKNISHFYVLLLM